MRRHATPVSKRRTGKRSRSTGWNGVASPTTIVYFAIEELDRAVASLKEAGLTFTKDPVDESWGWREARLTDPAGNEICLYRGGENRRFPPWRIDGRTKD